MLRSTKRLTNVLATIFVLQLGALCTMVPIVLTKALQAVK